MNTQEAGKKVLIKWLIGVVISAPSLISSIISLLKMLYVRLDDGTQLGGILARPFQQLVSIIYQNTSQYLELFWMHSPTPNLEHLFNLENLIFLTIYLFVFVGFAFIGSASILSKRLKKINQKIEDQMIEESIRGEVARTREQIELETEITSNSIFSQVHQLYLAPIVVGVIVVLVLKLAGV